MRTGPKNLITDVAGVLVGHADDAALASGVTALVFEEPAVAGLDVRGGGPGTRESDLLDPERTVERIDAIALSGGSAFGLDAGAGIMAALAARGRGFAVAGARVPIVPGAILFDLANGGDKNWGAFPPYRELGRAAAEAAADSFALGTAGAGFGARTANLKGGIGAASTVLDDGTTIGALAAVNSAGRVTIGDGPHFWAAPFEVGAEYGGLGWPAALPADALDFPQKPAPGANTTLAVVATDAALTKTQARRLAVMAQDGLARAIVPVHSPLDGDLVYAAATGRRPLAPTEGEAVIALARLGHAAALVVARAVARAVFAATALPFPGALPAWRDRFGGNV